MVQAQTRMHPSTPQFLGEKFAVFPALKHENRYSQRTLYNNYLNIYICNIDKRQKMSHAANASPHVIPSEHACRTEGLVVEFSPCHCSLPNAEISSAMFFFWGVAIIWFLTMLPNVNMPNFVKLPDFIVPSRAVRCGMSGD